VIELLLGGLLLAGAVLGACALLVVVVNLRQFLKNAFKYDNVSSKLSNLSWEMAEIGHAAHSEDFTDSEFRRMVKDKTRGREVVAR
jgi:hypothetical protein